MILVLVCLCASSASLIWWLVRVADRSARRDVRLMVEREIAVCARRIAVSYRRARK